MCVAAVRIAITTLCRREGLHANPRTGYPLQSRPHDLTEADLTRLVHTVVTPKVNGLEAFLFGHRDGFAIIFRSGIIHCYPWLPTHAPLFPLLLEGEVLFSEDTNRLINFIAYDLAVTPVQSYIETSRFSTRHACLRAVIWHLRYHCSPTFREWVRLL